MKKYRKGYVAEWKNIVRGTRLNGKVSVHDDDWKVRREVWGNKNTLTAIGTAPEVFRGVNTAERRAVAMAECKTWILLNEEEKWAR